MALVTFERTNEAEQSLSRILTESGYVDISSSPFLGSIVGAIKDSLRTEFGEMYNIARNVDIGRASGEYLERWGRFMDKSKEVLAYAMDLSLDNVSIALSTDELNAGNITTQGTGIHIPRGTSLATEDEGIVFELLDDVYMRPDRNRVYCRVICTTPGVISVPAGDITKVNLDLSEIDNALPSYVREHSLIANNEYQISGGQDEATDPDFRYALMEKSNAIGLFNEHAIRTNMINPEIAQIAISEYKGGVNVFVETTNIQHAEAISHLLNNKLRNRRSLGTNVGVYPPIIRYLQLEVSLMLTEDDPSKSTHERFTSALVDSINDIPMGKPIELTDIISDTCDMFDNVVSGRIVNGMYRGRELVRYELGTRFNEKLLTNEDRITVR